MPHQMTESLPARILLADDHLLFSNGLKLLLDQQPGWVVCGQVSTADQVFPAMHRLAPQLVVLDLNFAGTNGIDLGKKLLASFPAVKLLMLTMYNQVKLLEETRKAGLHGYLLKDTKPDDLFTGIQTIFAGGQVFDKRVLQLTDPTSDPFGDDFARRLNLTFREVEIIRLIRDGLTSEQISDRLRISFFTVKSHRKNIHTKLDLTNVADLIQFANRNKI